MSTNELAHMLLGAGMMAAAARARLEQFPRKDWFVRARYRWIPKDVRAYNFDRSLATTG